MKNILLPPRIGSDSPIILPSRSQISIVGANGAGKTKFMNKMIELSGDDAFSLSALEGIIPKTDDKESSIGLLF